ncbi:MAG: RsmD family RNA methyltransferase, partial [Acidothermus sp.]|nr:RsmD family RNA methyltransferase [Acidothermus sp.]
GMRIESPPSARPTADRVREALFSSLESLGGVVDQVVIDCFAGSGAIGLEAWSRGARRVVLIESAPTALRVLRANVTRLGAGREVEIWECDVATGPSRAPEAVADILIADPPYSFASQRLAEILRTYGASVLVPGALVVVERSRRDPWEWPEHFDPIRERRYGETVLHYASWRGLG